MKFEYLAGYEKNIIWYYNGKVKCVAARSQFIWRLCKYVLEISEIKYANFCEKLFGLF